METIQSYIGKLLETMEYLPIANIDQVIELLHNARKSKRKIFILGNGGSAATASHFVCDLLKNTRVAGYPSFRIIGLNDNMPAITALANDEGYINVFSQQLASLADAGDIVIAISTSGNSPNVLEAIEVANQMGLVTIGFTGHDGGKLGEMVHLNVLIPNNRADQTEDVHMIISHTITATLRDMAKPDVITLDNTALPYLPAMNQVVSEPDQQLTGNGHSSANGHSNGNSLVNGNGRHNGNNHLEPADPILEFITQLSQDSSPLFDSQEYLGRLLAAIVDLLDATSGSFTLLDENKCLVNAALIYNGELKNVDPKHMDKFLQAGLAGWVVQNKKSALLTSTRQDSRWMKRHTGSLPEMARSVICVPLTVQDDVIGVITVSRPEVQPFSIKDLLMLTGIVVALTSQIAWKISPL